MSSRQFKWALLVLAVSGLVGGALSSWLLPGRAAFAREEALQVVTARAFRLVDEADQQRAVLDLRDNGQPNLAFFDAAGAAPLGGTVKARRQDDAGRRAGVLQRQERRRVLGSAEAESPYPDENQTYPMRAGMCVNSDISLWGALAGSNRIEEGFVIGETGPESVTPLIRELAARGV